MRCLRTWTSSARSTIAMSSPSVMQDPSQESCPANFLWSRPLIPLAAIRAGPGVVLQSHVAVRADVSTALGSCGQPSRPPHDRPMKHQRALTFDRTLFPRLAVPAISSNTAKTAAVSSDRFFFVAAA